MTLSLKKIYESIPLFQNITIDDIIYLQHIKIGLCQDNENKILERLSQIFDINIIKYVMDPISIDIYDDNNHHIEIRLHFASADIRTLHLTIILYEHITTHISLLTNINNYEPSYYVEIFEQQNQSVFCNSDYNDDDKLSILYKLLTSKMYSIDFKKSALFLYLILKHS